MVSTMASRDLPGHLVHTIRLDQADPLTHMRDQADQWLIRDLADLIPFSDPRTVATSTEDLSVPPDLKFPSLTAQALSTDPPESTRVKLVPPVDQPAPSLRDPPDSRWIVVKDPPLPVATCLMAQEDPLTPHVPALPTRDLAQAPEAPLANTDPLDPVLDQETSRDLALPLPTPVLLWAQDPSPPDPLPTEDVL